MMKTDQYLSDKIKAARVSEDGEGWLTFEDKRYRITTKPEAVGALTYYSVLAFVRCKRGIELVPIHRHDGSGGRIRYSAFSRYLNDKDVMALVVEEHSRT
jgi:hypothetical protein